MSNEKLQNILAILAIYEKLWAFENKRPFRLSFNLEELNLLSEVGFEPGNLHMQYLCLIQ